MRLVFSSKILHFSWTSSTPVFLPLSKADSLHKEVNGDLDTDEIDPDVLVSEQFGADVLKGTELVLVNFAGTVSLVGGSTVPKFEAHDDNDFPNVVFRSLGPPFISFFGTDSVFSGMLAVGWTVKESTQFLAD